MSYIRSVMEEEYQRLESLSGKYHAQISSLPKGSVSIKKRGRKKYLYLAYRQKDKVVSEYVGPEDSENAKAVIEKVRCRKLYEDKLRQVKKDLTEIRKVLHGRKI
ncbi:hypothetical protein QUF80_05500 [Desulfococcaceae bacterium HSG8]|nr:hypothetical protein [Desulfococcaceae bacterium HSG8]